MTKLEQIETYIRKVCPETMDTFSHIVSLDRVLRAINKARGLTTEFCVDSAGEFYSFGCPSHSDTHIAYCGVRWRLTKPLKDQSPELIDFLFNIFYSNESNKR